VFQTSDDLVEALLGAIEIDCYDLFGFSIVCNSAHISLDVARRVKAQSTNAVILAGGPYGTKISSEVLCAFPFIDGVAVGEGEKTIQAILSAHEEGTRCLRVPGVVTREGNNCATQIINDMDCLPFIGNNESYYEALDAVREIVPEGAATPLEATRGCPLKCSFCSTRQVWGASVRRKSARKLVDEMDRISARNGQTFFSLIGDNVGVPRAPFIRFCNEMAQLNERYTWGCSLKLDKLEKSHIPIMYEAGCRAIFVGLESASQATLDQVNKTASIRKELEMVQACIDFGMHVETSFIIGFPWETEEDIWDTYRLHCEMLQAGAFRSQVSLLSPIPGTQIVSDSKIIFDGLQSYLTDDGLRLSQGHLDWIEEFPDLFSHFGHYETPNMSRITLKALRDASSQFASIHATQRKKNPENSGNHGRALGATYPYGRKALETSAQG